MDPITRLFLFWVRFCMRGRELWTRPRLLAWQRKKLQQLRSYTYANSPYYRSFHKGLENRRLSMLPVLNKKQLMQNYDDILTNRTIRLTDIYAHMAGGVMGAPLFGKFPVMTTSGSTGNTGIFIFDNLAWAHVLALEYRLLDIAETQIRPGHRSVCVTSALPWHQSWQIAHALPIKRGQDLYIGAEEPLEAVVDKLNQFQPNSLFTYANLLNRLAERQELSIRPQNIFCGGEVLNNEMRSRIKIAFSNNPFNLYGLTEVGNVASDCVIRDGMHINEDFVIIENVDEYNKEVPPGTAGSKVLITVLFNFLLPLIRYEISDRMVISDDPCACGRIFRKITEIEGRLEDMLHLIDKNGLQRQIHPNFFHALLDIETLQAWQIFARGQHITVHLVLLSPSFNVLKLQEKLKMALEKANFPAVQISIEITDDLIKGKTGKTKLINWEPA